MTQDTVVCRPTPWFLFRAAAMLLMFGIFAVLFYIDGSTGYRQKNETYFLRQTFREASSQFEKMNATGNLTPAQWREHAVSQNVALPEDRSIMPVSSPVPYPWPAILHDYEKMKPLQWAPLWESYSQQRGLASKPPEQPYDAGKIREQWIVFWICLALALIAAFFFIRTKFRTMKVDDTGFTAADGTRVAYTDMTTLDLRKWQNKGLAFVEFRVGSQIAKVRVDGLTYGGFRTEDGEPAEQLMNRIRENFRGEIIEMAAVPPAASAES